MTPEEKRAGTAESLADKARRVGEKLPSTSAPEYESGSEKSPERERQEQLYRRLVTRFEHAAEERYRRGDELASGGQGTVYRVWDEDLDRNLAMKVVHEPRSSNTTRLLARFLDEARITGQLDHPGVVPVHELGIDADGRVFFTMKLVRGRDLGRVLEDVRRGDTNWTATRVVGVFLKVCEAMAYAHDKGVIHRDLKPQNVMVGDFGEVYVMDWGLARVFDPEDQSVDDEIPRPPAEDEVPHAKQARPKSAVVVGTPVYMSPEQARGSLDAMGPASDVYAIGALLYQLLTGQIPHVGRGESPSSIEVLLRVMSETPTPIAELAPDASPELVAICEKAMAHDPEGRYPSMLALAEDLRAHLENRVVGAYESGAVAELKKRIARNRGVFLTGLAAIGVLIVGLVAALVLRAQAERQRADVLRLSAIQELRGLIAEADGLWPATPERIPDYTDWLDRAEHVVAGLTGDADRSGHYEQVERLRSSARVLTGEERADLVRTHPRAHELEALEGELAARTRAQQIRSGARTLEPFELDPARAALGWVALNELAWLLVNPERTRFGREREGLALAERAFAAAPADGKAEVGDTLAWAYLWNGLDSEALAAIEAAALENAAFAENVVALRAEQERLSGESGERLIVDLETRRDALERELTLVFPDEESSWWYTQLDELVRELEAFSDRESGLIAGSSPRWGWGIGERLAFARTVEERSVTGPAARAAWKEALASIADEGQCPDYRGARLTPQLGLLPVGRDPASGLWEFAHVQSGEVPGRDAEGRLVLDEGSAVVLVLIPPGSLRMRFEVQGEERLSKPVELAPYFLAKYELTQGQWHRIARTRPSYWANGVEYGAHVTDDRHPVESISWERAADVLAQLDLDLPTEAQWDHAVRGGTNTAWFLGDLDESGYPSLSRYANLADASASGRPWGKAREGSDYGLDDGYMGSAPVDAFLPNPYGLHGMLGNVREWCRDWNDEYYYEPRPGDGEREVLNRVNKVSRGGCMASGVESARSSARWKNEPGAGAYYLGVRPARPVR